MTLLNIIYKLNCFFKLIHFFIFLAKWLSSYFLVKLDSAQPKLIPILHHVMTYIFTHLHISDVPLVMTSIAQLSAIILIKGIHCHGLAVFQSFGTRGQLSSCNFVANSILEKQALMRICFLKINTHQQLNAHVGIGGGFPYLDSVEDD